MFTKLFKKSHDPYELGGRWYKIRIVSDDSGWSVDADHSDIYNGITCGGSEPSGRRIIIPASYGNVIQYSCVYGSNKYSGASILGPTIGVIYRETTGTSYSLLIPPSTVWSYCDLYVFIVEGD